jgi:hypothetical protein
VTRDALGLRPGAEVDFDPDGETVRIMAAGDTPLGAAPLRWDSPVMGGALPAAGQWTSSHPGAVRRLSGCAALVVAAVALRGTLGVLLGIVALLLLLDAVVPMPPGTRSQADDRFRALVRRRRRARRAGRVRRRPPERLEVLDDASGDIAAAERSALGVQLIAIGSITGTVEELKARAFDREFPPRGGVERALEAAVARAGARRHAAADLGLPGRRPPRRARRPPPDLGRARPRPPHHRGGRGRAAGRRAPMQRAARGGVDQAGLSSDSSSDSSRFFG